MPQNFMDCASPTAIDLMFASVMVYADVPGIIADQGIIDATVGFDPLTLPPFWQFQTGGCNGPANLLFSSDFTTGPYGCYDMWQGLGTTGGQWGGEAGPTPVGNRARIKFTTAVLAENPVMLPANTPTYTVRVGFKHTNVALCPGCETPVCFVYNEEQLSTLGGQTLRITQSPGFVAANAYPNDINCPGSTPTKARTWGQVKSLYR
jgi:hypothetical protein